MVPVTGSFGRAVRAGMTADGLGTAFLGGYRQALATFGVSERASLAATEDGPVHPRTFATRFENGRLYGHKRWVTGVPGAEELVVIAVAGEDAGRRRIVAAVVPIGAVELRPMPATAFVPDVPHAEVVLDGVTPDRVLPGDGWADVVRPFRTVEDVHVVGAAHGYLLGAAARAGFGRDVVASLWGTLAALTTIAGSPPGDPEVHLALAGVLATFRTTVSALAWSSDTEEAARWARDVPLLSVAERARTARLEAAWAQTAGLSSP